jgi:hypothetical protein
MSDAASGWQAQLWHDLGVPAVLAGGASLIAWARHMRARRRSERELRMVELDSTRKALDGVRQALWMLHDPTAQDTDDAHARLAVTRHEIDEVRERLWIATGHVSRRPSVSDIVRELKRTQPVRPVDEERP